MLDRSLPPTRRSASLESAAINDRLAHVPGRGRELAPLLWIMVLALPDRRGIRRANNETLALNAGMAWSSEGIRQTERALAVLRRSGMLETRIGKRPGARRPNGRILEPQITAPELLVPDRNAMTNLWLTCHEARRSPAALVTLMVGAYALACHHGGGWPVYEWSPVGTSQAALRRFVGASKGSTWNRRLGDLEGLGLLSRGPLAIAPPEEWFQGWRALSRLG